MRRIAILLIGIAIPAFCQTAPAPAAGAAPAAAPKGPHPKSAEENNALVAMFKAPDPDAQIKAVDELLQKYPDTDYKAQALMVQATAYHMKKNDPKATVAAEQALDIDPKNYETLLLLAEIISRNAKATDFDLNDQLTKSDKYAKDALAILATAEKPKADLPDDQWNGLKQGESQRAYVALGFSALLRKKYDDAKTNFDKGISLYPDPLDMLYIERAYTIAKRYDDALAWIAKAAGSTNADDNVKRITASDKTRVEGLKKAAAAQ